ncbi:rod shape-determining protein MreC [Sphaerotilus hippei]|uniref:Cell shape-determining protein MreC n=1 Tax=Sphaerotilus hippei TaxID=744406 RepID=A0A318H1M0_9BURK|nr:rod shape-determining protein MreC [Sphaerotilus hippei]PXW96912.1 rod shape-determining protein MreC [Sphaerotilus hippei]
MPLGTLDRTPPPFFRQGPSALTRLAFFASLAIFLMAADTRMALTPPLRIAAAVVLNPIEQAMLAPIAGYATLGDYLHGVGLARQTAEAATAELTRQSVRSLQVEQLLKENARLRNLLELRERLTVRSRSAQLIYEAPDPYSRKVVIDIGSRQGVVAGAPVVNEEGVLGQVTRLYPGTAEVTLLIDRDAALSVLNSRTQSRSIAAGEPGSDGLSLRFVAGNADVAVGDLLQTTGLDGVYPGGLPVAWVSRVDRRTQADFARITLTPAARLDGVRHVLVLEPLASQLPTPPSDSAASAPAAAASALQRQESPAAAAAPRTTQRP